MKKLMFTGLLILSLPVLAAKPEWVEEKQNGKGASHSHVERGERQDEDHRDKGKAQDRSHNHERQYEERRYDDRRHDDEHRYSDRYLRDSDRDLLLRRVLTEYYGVEYVVDRKRYKPLPPGLRKKLARGGELPPGWRDKLVRGQVIDPLIYRHAEHLPSDLLNRLTGRQDGIELLRVGDRIVRVMEGRGTVLDVIDLSDRALGLFD